MIRRLLELAGRLRRPAPGPRPVGLDPLEAEHAALIAGQLPEGPADVIPPAPCRVVPLVRFESPGPRPLYHEAIEDAIRRALADARAKVAAAGGDPDLWIYRLDPEGPLDRVVIIATPPPLPGGADA